MGVTSFDDGCLQAIARLAEAPHLSIVVGAGASIAAQLPGWESLVLRLLRSSAGEQGQKVAELLADTQGYLLAAEAAFAPNASPAQRKSKVRKALYEGKPLAHLVPSKLHQAVARLAASRTPADLQIFSTNYDDLLEQAFSDENVDCAPRIGGPNRIKPSVFPIHHIHGYLGPTDESADVVIGQSDYNRIFDAAHDWPGEEIGTAASKGPILFVGASLTDPNLVRILGRVKDRAYDRHVLVLARQGLNFAANLHSPFRHRLATQWLRYNVELVLLEDFRDNSLFVRELERPFAGVGPRQRVEKLWRSVTDNYSSYQQRLEAGLQEIFNRHLRSMLGEDSRFEMWLTDGQGNLVLVAVKGVIQLLPNELLRIPDRFDAGHAVNGAIANEGTLLRNLDSSTPGKAEGPEMRWSTIAAAPLRLELQKRKPTIVGAISVASTRKVVSPSELAVRLETRVAVECEDFLRTLVG